MRIGIIALSLGGCKPFLRVRPAVAVCGARTRRGSRGQSPGERRARYIGEWLRDEARHLAWWTDPAGLAPPVMTGDLKSEAGLASLPAAPNLKIRARGPGLGGCPLIPANRDNARRTGAGLRLLL